MPAVAEGVKDDRLALRHGVLRDGSGRRGAGSPRPLAAPREGLVEMSFEAVGLRKEKT